MLAALCAFCSVFMGFFIGSGCGRLLPQGLKGSTQGRGIEAGEGARPFLCYAE